MATKKEEQCFDDAWIDKLIDDLNNITIPDSTALTSIDVCNVVNNDPTKPSFSENIYSFYKTEINEIARNNVSMKKEEQNDLLLKGIESSIELATRLEIENVNIKNKNIEQGLNNALIKLKVLETTAGLKISIEKFKMERSMFLIEMEIAYARLLSTRADYMLKKTQAVSFVFNQRAKLVDILFNTLTIGVTQELMHILENPNVMLGGLSPKQKFEEAWMDDSPYLKEIDDIQWEGLQSIKTCLCDLCK